MTPNTLIHGELTESEYLHTIGMALLEHEITKYEYQVQLADGTDAPDADQFVLEGLRLAQGILQRARRGELV